MGKVRSGQDTYMPTVEVKEKINIQEVQRDGQGSTANGVTQKVNVEGVQEKSEGIGNSKER